MNSLDTLLGASKKIFHGDQEIRQVFKGEDPAWTRQAPYFYLKFENIPVSETN